MNKNFKRLILSLIGGTAVCAASAALPKGFDNVEPPYWWTGMNNDSLQIMLTGPDMAEAAFELDYPGVRLASQVALDSKNYKFLNLVISPEATPGTLKFKYRMADGKKGTLPYELRQRTMRAEDHKGFGPGDVLYLLMPDRFAKGLPESKEQLKGLDFPVGADRSNPNARHGGDMRGIADHLDYLDSLGVTAIWV